MPKARHTLLLLFWMLEKSLDIALTNSFGDWNCIASAIDQHETVVGVFLDLSKAFDTPNHQILFAKLEHLSVSKVSVEC